MTTSSVRLIQVVRKMNLEPGFGMIINANESGSDTEKGGDEEEEEVDENESDLAVDEPRT